MKCLAFLPCQIYALLVPCLVTERVVNGGVASSNGVDRFITVDLAAAGHSDDSSESGENETLLPVNADGDGSDEAVREKELVEFAGENVHGKSQKKQSVLVVSYLIHT